MKQSGGKDLGKILRRLREKNELGIKTAAPKAEVTYTYLSKVENGHRTPSPELIKKLCEIYGANYEQVASIAGNLPPDIEEIFLKHGSAAFDFLRKKFGTDSNNK